MKNIKYDNGGKEEIGKTFTTMDSAIKRGYAIVLEEDFVIHVPLYRIYWIQE